MNEEKTIKAVNILLLIASALIYYGLLYYVTEDHYSNGKDNHVSKTEEIKAVPEIKSDPLTLIKAFELKGTVESQEITYQTLETEYLGVYFITAYCPEECGGSWQTSSGATCHYSSDNSEPTTCAIDRSYHGYNELIVVDGKLYITEDTGPGVQGRWVDCFVLTMEEVNAWPTGYKPVYSASYATHTLSGRNRRLNHERFTDYLLNRRSSAGPILRDAY